MLIIAGFYDAEKDCVIAEWCFLSLVHMLLVVCTMLYREICVLKERNRTLYIIQNNEHVHTEIVYMQQDLHELALFVCLFFCFFFILFDSMYIWAIFFALNRSMLVRKSNILVWTDLEFKDFTVCDSMCNFNSCSLCIQWWTVHDDCSSALCTNLEEFSCFLNKGAQICQDKNNIQLRFDLRVLCVYLFQYLCLLNFFPL
jgi:hypothetical protein